jgi:hypothetical protein
MATVGKDMKGSMSSTPRLENILGKDNLLVSKYYPRFTNLKAAITNYYRTKRFNLNIVKYLLRESANLC